MTMKRDKNLRNLSSDHHQALNLSRKIFNAVKDHKDSPEFISQVKIIFQNDLSPHFDIVENSILPELIKAGEITLVNKTLEDHSELKMLVSRLEKPGYLSVFAERLKAHVKFEEKELFEACQNNLDEAALDRIGHYCDR